MAQKFLTYGFIFLLLWAGNGFGQNPLPPNITSITVKPQPNYPGAVELFWIDDNVPSADGFIIFRYEYGFTQGFDSIGTVRSPEFSFLDLEAKANEYSESYVIVSYREPGYKLSPKSDTSFTMFLRPIEFDTCAQTAKLNWSPYIGWGDDGVKYYKVYRNAIDQKYDKKDTVFSQLIELETEYEYFIRAIRNNGNFSSESNRVSITFTSYKKPNPDSFFIHQITNRGNSIEVQSNVDVSADIKKYALLFSAEKDGLYDTAIFNYELTSESILFNHEYSGTPIYYKVAALNQCNQIAGETQHVKPLQLKVAMLNYDVTLTWDSSFVDATSEEYKVFVSVDGGDAVSKENTKEFKLNELGSETSEKFCFFVEATDNNGNKSISQTECVTRTPIVEIPEAFSPNGDGTNEYFGPFVNSIPEKSYIKDVSVTSFKLHVYDRYGGIVFYTTNSGEFWDGTKNGVSVSEGAYLYHYTYTTSLGKSYEGSGAINVVYP
jgi:gliding motility-associated-like protein